MEIISISDKTIDDIIKYGIDVTHKEHGKLYNVVGKVLCKNIDTGQWYKAIHYVNAQGQSFVRDKKDFYDKFKIIGDKQ